MKILGRLLLGVVAVLVALGVAGTAIVMSTDADQVSEFVAERVKAATGRDLFIDGDIGMKFSLVPTVSASDVRFSNAAWGSRADMVRLKRLEVGLELLPLLRGEIRLSELRLVEPDILLERHADGRGNWVLSPESRSPEGQQENVDDGGELDGLPILSVLSVEQGRLKFIDEAANYQREMLLQRIDLAGDSIDERMQVDIAVESDGEAYTVGGSVSSLYRLLIDARFFNFDLVVTALGASVDVRGVIQAPLTRRLVDAKVSALATDGRNTLGRVGKILNHDALADLPLDGGLKTSFRVTGTADNLAIENIEAVAGRKSGLNLTISGDVRSALSKPAWVFNVTASVPDPSVVSKVIGQSLPSSPAVTLGATVSNNDQGFLIDNGVVSIGNTKLAGNFQVGASKSPVMVTGAISADVIRLEDLRPYFPANPTDVPSNKDERIIPDFQLPINILPTVDGSLKFVVGTLELDGFKISDIALAISKRGQKIDLSVPKAQVAGGRISGTAVLDGNSTEATIAADLGYRGGDVGRLIAYLTDLNLVRGNVDADIKLAGNGQTLRQIAGNLNGRVEVIMDQGQVADRYVDLLAADVLAELMPWAGQTRDVQINCFVSRFEIKDGLATNTGLLFDTDKLAVTGGGIINLKDERLDMRLNPKPKESKLVSLGVPINITGTLGEPKVAPTAGAVVKGVAGFALALVNPLTLLLAVVEKGDARNDCIAALDRSHLLKTSPSGSQSTSPAPIPERKPSSPVGKVIDGVGKGIEGVGKGIGKAIEGILGGGK